MLKKLVGFAVACGAWMLVSPAYASPQHDGYGYGGGGELRCESAVRHQLASLLLNGWWRRPDA